MTTITHFAHPSDLEADEMFVLRAERDIWGEVLQDKVGDMDMLEPAELVFSRGMHPRYHRQIHLVASDAASPSREDDVLGVATLEFFMADNPRLATIGVAVRMNRRGEGIGAALHAAALEVARNHGRLTIQAWTWEPPEVPPGGVELGAETGSGSVDATSPESHFLMHRGYVLGQFERISRLGLSEIDEATARRDEALDNKPEDFEVITLMNDVPERLFSGIAELCAAMASDTPTGAMDLEDELWDADRFRASLEEIKTADRDQLLTVVRHIPSKRLVGFTRLFRDKSRPEVAHQWETLVLGEHRGHGLGMLMKVVNHGAVAEFWPEAQRLITGNASENSHMLAINDALGFEPYAANGFWELRLRGTDS